ncbi:MAG: hypothetical protein AAF354_07305 [Pseudomonadota bacterium]
MGYLSQIAVESEGEGGDFTPILKYKPQAGRLYIDERSENANGDWESKDVNVKLPIKFVADFDSMAVGPIAFLTGVGPDAHLVPLKDVEAKKIEPPDPPSPKHKHGFVMNVFSEKSLGGVREWMGTQKSVMAPIGAAVDEWRKDPDGMTAGKLPVINFSDVTEVTMGTGERKKTLFAPILKIEKYVDRPDGLKPTTRANGNGGSTVTTAAQPQSNHVPPPAGGGDVVPNPADDDDHLQPCYCLHICPCPGFSGRLVCFACLPGSSNQ